MFLGALLVSSHASAQSAIDQQNSAAAWTCLNPSFFTMSQGFTPTFNRMNFAEIHLSANAGSVIDGDFSLRVLRNGSLVRESDRLIIDAVPGMQSGYHRFIFSDEAFLQRGQPYELQLVNHSNTSFFTWCQSQTNSYSGGSPSVSPSGGGSGDFLFRTGMQSIFSPPQATNNGPGYLLFESALKPQTHGTGGVSASSNFYTGLNFEVKEPTRLAKIGGYFTNSGQVFGAVFRTTGFTGKPSPVNLTGDDVVATTQISVPSSGSDAWGDVDVMLEPGWYGVVFGTGRFGVPNGSNGFYDLGDSNGTWIPYTLVQSSGQQFFQNVDIRVFAQAASAPGTMQQRPVFDTNAERFNGQWILTDGSVEIAPYRHDFFGTDNRGLLEFDITQVPEGAKITSATLSLDPSQMSSGVGAAPRVHLHGYAGDGLASADDAAQPLNLIGSSDAITSFDVFDVDLNTDYVQSLVDQGATHLGLMARGDANGDRLHVRSWESGSIESAPLLTIAYTLPGDFDGDGLVDAADLQDWKSRFGVDLDGNDFLTWQRNLDGGAAADPVPEPATWHFATMLGLVLAAYSKRRAD